MKKTILFLSILFLFALIGCTQAVNFTINFDSNGGTEVLSVETSGSTSVTIPDDPTKDGYIFDGWYWDDDSFEEPFASNSLLNSPISENASVYAKWETELDIFDLVQQMEWIYNASCLFATLNSITNMTNIYNTYLKLINLEVSRTEAEMDFDEYWLDLEDAYSSNYLNSDLYDSIEFTSSFMLQTIIGWGTISNDRGTPMVELTEHFLSELLHTAGSQTDFEVVLEAYSVAVLESIYSNEFSLEGIETVKDNSYYSFMYIYEEYILPEGNLLGLTPISASYLTSTHDSIYSSSTVAQAYIYGFEGGLDLFYYLKDAEQAYYIIQITDVYDSVRLGTPESQLASIDLAYLHAVDLLDELHFMENMVIVVDEFIAYLNTNYSD